METFFDDEEFNEFVADEMSLASRRIERLECELEELKVAFVSLTNVTAALLTDIGNMHAKLSGDDIFSTRSSYKSEEELLN